jgi:hypothetical protein
MSIDRTAITVLERTPDGKLRTLTLDKITSLKAVSGAQYTLVDVATKVAPKGLVLKKVGLSLVIDVAGEANVIELAEFYKDAGATFFTDGALPATASATGAAASTAAAINLASAVVATTAAGEAVVFAATGTNLAAATAAAGTGLGSLATISGIAGGAALAASGGGGSAAAAAVVSTVGPTVVALATPSAQVVDGITYTNSAALSVSAAASGVTRTYTVDGGTASANYTAPTTAGAHTVVVKDVDASGHSSAATLSFTLQLPFDAAGLALQHDTGRSGTDHITNNAALTVSAAAPGAHRTYSVDGGAASSSYTAPTTAGAHTVVVTDTDNAGNTASATLAFTLATGVAAPVVVLAHDNGSSHTDALTNDASLSLSTPADGVTRSYSVDGGSATDAYTAPSSNGTHTVRVTDTDAAGNTASTTLTFTLATGVATPTVALAHDNGTSHTDKLTNDASLSLSAPAEGVTRSYSVDGGTPSANYTAPGSNGAHSVVVTDSDAAGNSASATLSFTLATGVATPTIALAHDNGSSSTDKLTNDASLSLSARADGVSRSYSVDGGAASDTYTAPSSNGAHTVRVTDTDAAGNGASSALTFTLATANLAAPTSALHQDNGASSTDNTTNTGLIDVGGLADGASWRYTVDGGAHWQAGSGSGFTLAEGRYAPGLVQVQQLDSAGNASVVSANAGALVIDLTAPATPSSSLQGTTNLVGSTVYTNGSQVSFSGAESGATVQFSLDGGSHWATAGSSAPIPEATYAPGQLKLRQIDLAGNISNVDTNSQTVVVDRTINTPSFTLRADTGVGGNNSDGLTKNPTIDVGNLESGASWRYSTDAGSTWHAGSGSSFTVGEGTYSANAIRVEQTDLAGNTSNAARNNRTLQFDLTAPVAGTAAVDGNLTNNTKPVLHGVAEPASIVTVTVDGHSYSNLSDLNGAYSVTVTSALADGSYTPTVTVTDLAGNATSGAGTTFTVDTQAPTNGGVLSVASDSGAVDNITNVAAPAIIGHTEPLAHVSIAIGGQVVTGLADADGNYSVTVPSGLRDGTYTPVITATDDAGNATVRLGTAFTIDTLAPPNADAAITAASDSGASNADGITRVTAPVITGTTEAGATVSIAINGLAQPLTATADTDGHFSVTVGSALADGVHTPQITVTDTAGNSATYAGHPFTVVTALATPTLALADDSAGFSRSDLLTNNAALAISQPAEPGVHRSYSVDGGSATDSYTAPTLEGAHTVVVTDTDIAGNSRSSNTLSFTLDTHVEQAGISLHHEAVPSYFASEAGITLPYDTFPASNNGVVTVTGLETNATWEYTSDGGQNWQQGEGTAFTLTDGQYGIGQVRLRETDAAGNVGTPLVLAPSVVDTQAPEVHLTLAADTGASSTDRITNNGTIEVSGTEGAAFAVAFLPPSNGASFYSPEFYRPITGQDGHSFTLAEGTYLGGYYYTNAESEGTLVAAAVVDQAGNFGEEWLTLPDLIVDTHVDPAHLSLQHAAVDVTAMNALSVTLPYDTFAASNTGVVSVADLEAGATWEYTTNAGQSWQQGQGSSFTLADGAYGDGQVQIRETDLAGNIGTPVYLGASTVDTVAAPIKLVLVQDSGVFADNGDLVTRNGMVDVAVDGIETGAAVVFSMDGGNSWQPVNGEHGHSFTLPEGSYAPGSVQVMVIDLAGNESTTTLTTEGTLVVDTTPPVDPVMSLNYDNGPVHSDGVSNNGRIDVNGLEAGSQWRYSTDGGTSWSQLNDTSISGFNHFNLPGDGTAQYGTTFAPGTLHVQEFDAAGNATDVVINTNPIVYDIVAPVLSGFETLVTNNTAQHPPALLTGQIEAGASLVLELHGTTFTQGDGHLTVDADGAWRLDFSALSLPDGHYGGQIWETDLAGNVAYGSVTDGLWIANDSVVNLGGTLGNSLWAADGTVDFGAHVTVLGGINIEGDGSVVFDPTSGDMTIGGAPNGNDGLNVTAGVVTVLAEDNLLFDHTGIHAHDHATYAGNSDTAQDLLLDTEVHVSAAGDLLMDVDFGTAGPGIVAPAGGKGMVYPALLEQTDISDYGNLDITGAIALSAGGDLAMFGTSTARSGVFGEVLLQQQNLSAWDVSAGGAGNLHMADAAINLTGHHLDLVNIYHGTVDTGHYVATENYTTFNGVTYLGEASDLHTSDGTTAFSALSVVNVALEQTNLRADYHIDASGAAVRLRATGEADTQPANTGPKHAQPNLLAGNVSLLQAGITAASADLHSASISIESNNAAWLLSSGAAVFDGQGTLLDSTWEGAEVGITQAGIGLWAGDLDASNAQVHIMAAEVVMGNAAVVQADISATDGTVLLHDSGIDITAAGHVDLVSTATGIFGDDSAGAVGGSAVLAEVSVFATAIDESHAHLSISAGAVAAGELAIFQAFEFATLGDLNASDAVIDVHAASAIDLQAGALNAKLGLVAAGTIEAQGAQVHLAVGDHGHIQAGMAEGAQPGILGVAPASSPLDFFGTLAGDVGGAMILDASLFARVGVDVANADLAISGGLGADISAGAALIVMDGLVAQGFVDASNARLSLAMGGEGTASFNRVELSENSLMGTLVDASGASIGLHMGDYGHLNVVALESTVLTDAVFLSQSDVTAYGGGVDLSQAHITIDGGYAATLHFEAHSATVTSTGAAFDVYTTTFQGTDVFLAQDQITAFGSTADLSEASVQLSVANDARISLDGGSVYIEQHLVTGSDVHLDNASVNLIADLRAHIDVLSNPWEYQTQTGHMTYTSVYNTHWTTYETLVDGTSVSHLTTFDTVYDHTETAGSTTWSTLFDHQGGDVYIWQGNVKADGGMIDATHAQVLVTNNGGGNIEIDGSVYVAQTDLQALASHIDLNDAAARVQTGTYSSVQIGQDIGNGKYNAGVVEVYQARIKAGLDVEATAVSAEVIIASSAVNLGQVDVHQTEISVGGDLDLHNAHAGITGSSASVFQYEHGEQRHAFFDAAGLQRQAVFVEQSYLTATHVNMVSASAEITLGGAYPAFASLGGSIFVYQFHIAATTTIDDEQAHAGFTVGDGAMIKAQTTNSVFVGQQDMTSGKDIELSTASAEVTAGGGANVFVHTIFVDDRSLTAAGKLHAHDDHAGLTVGSGSTVGFGKVFVKQRGVTAGGDIDLHNDSAVVSVGSGVTLSAWGDIYVNHGDVTATGSIDAYNAHAGFTAGSGGTATLHDVYMAQGSMTAGDIAAAAAGGNLNAYGATADVSIGSGNTLNAHDIYVSMGGDTVASTLDGHGALAGLTVGSGNSIALHSIHVVQGGLTAANIDLHDGAAYVTLDNGGNTLSMDDNIFVSDSGNTASGHIDAHGAHALVTAGMGNTLHLGQVYVAQSANDATGKIDEHGAYATITLGDGGAISARNVYVKQTDLHAGSGANIDLHGDTAGLTGAHLNGLSLGDVYITQGDLTAGGVIDGSTAHAAVHIDSDGTAASTLGSVYVNQGGWSASDTISAQDAHAGLTAGSGVDMTASSIYVMQSGMTATNGLNGYDAAAYVSLADTSTLHLSSVYIQDSGLSAGGTIDLHNDRASIVHNVSVPSGAGANSLTVVASHGVYVDFGGLTAGGGITGADAFAGVTLGSGDTLILSSAHVHQGGLRATGAIHLDNDKAEVTVGASSTIVMSGDVYVDQSGLTAGTTLDVHGDYADLSAGNGSHLTLSSIHVTQSGLSAGGTLDMHGVGAALTVGDGVWVTFAHDLDIVQTGITADTVNGYDVHAGITAGQGGTFDFHNLFVEQAGIHAGTANSIDLHNANLRATFRDGGQITAHDIYVHQSGLAANDITLNGSNVHIEMGQGDHLALQHWTTLTVVGSAYFTFDTGASLHVEQAGVTASHGITATGVQALVDGGLGSDLHAKEVLVQQHDMTAKTANIDLHDALAQVSIGGNAALTHVDVHQYNLHAGDVKTETLYDDKYFITHQSTYAVSHWGTIDLTHAEITVAANNLTASDIQIEQNNLWAGKAVLLDDATVSVDITSTLYSTGWVGLSQHNITAGGDEVTKAHGTLFGTEFDYADGPTVVGVIDAIGDTVTVMASEITIGDLSLGWGGIGIAHTYFTAGEAVHVNDSDIFVSVSGDVTASWLYNGIGSNFQTFSGATAASVDYNHNTIGATAGGDIVVTYLEQNASADSAFLHMDGNTIHLSAGGDIHVSHLEMNAVEGLPFATVHMADNRMALTADGYISIHDATFVVTASDSWVTANNNDQYISGHDVSIDMLANIVIQGTPGDASFTGSGNDVTVRGNVTGGHHVEIGYAELNGDSAHATFWANDVSLDNLHQSNPAQQHVSVYGQHVNISLYDQTNVIDLIDVAEQHVKGSPTAVADWWQADVYVANAAYYDASATDADHTHVALTINDMELNYAQAFIELGLWSQDNTYHYDVTMSDLGVAVNNTLAGTAVAWENTNAFSNITHDNSNQFDVIDLRDLGITAVNQLGTVGTGAHDVHITLGSQLKTKHIVQEVEFEYTDTYGDVLHIDLKNVNLDQGLATSSWLNGTTTNQKNDIWHWIEDYALHLSHGIVD